MQNTFNKSEGKNNVYETSTMLAKSMPKCTTDQNPPNPCYPFLVNKRQLLNFLQKLQPVHRFSGNKLSPFVRKCFLFLLNIVSFSPLPSGLGVFLLFVVVGFWFVLFFLKCKISRCKLQGGASTKIRCEN